MAQTIQDVMSAPPTSLPAGTPLREAARAMRDGNIGDVLVVDGGRLRGIATDRDVVVRGLAEHDDISSVTLQDVLSGDPVSVAPDTSVTEAVELMRRHAIRRLPVVRDGQAVGIVSLGDLAIERDQSSVLADISAAPADS